MNNQCLEFLPYCMDLNLLLFIFNGNVDLYMPEKILFETNCDVQTNKTCSTRKSKSIGLQEIMMNKSMCFVCQPICVSTGIRQIVIVPTTLYHVYDAVR
jgi:hypothetical protein